MSKKVTQFIFKKVDPKMIWKEAIDVALKAAHDKENESRKDDKYYEQDWVVYIALDISHSFSNFLLKNNIGSYLGIQHRKGFEDTKVHCFNRRDVIPKNNEYYETKSSAINEAMMVAFRERLETYGISYVYPKLNNYIFKV